MPWLYFTLQLIQRAIYLYCFFAVYNTHGANYYSWKLFSQLWQLLQEERNRQKKKHPKISGSDRWGELPTGTWVPHKWSHWRQCAEKYKYRHKYNICLLQMRRTNQQTLKCSTIDPTNQSSQATKNWCQWVFKHHKLKQKTCKHFFEQLRQFIWNSFPMYLVNSGHKQDWGMDDISLACQAPKRVFSSR